MCSDRPQFVYGVDLIMVLVVYIYVGIDLRRQMVMGPYAVPDFRAANHKFRHQKKKKIQVLILLKRTSHAIIFHASINNLTFYI